jgi:cobalt-zinc-cadmium efflux system outer membrane protein
MSSLCFFPFRHCAFLTAIAVAFYFALYSSGPLADEPALSLQQSVEQALSGNPSIAEIKSRAEAMAAIPSQEGALPDPTLNFGMLNVPTRSFNLQKEDMTMIEVGLSQTIPFPGKLALKEKAAEHEALAAASSVEDARLRLARDVKKAWWRLFYYDHALSVTEDAERFFQQLVDVAQVKYQVGQGNQQDVLMAQLELSKLKDEKLELAGMRHTENIQFNVLLNRERETPVRILRQEGNKLPELTDAALQEQAMRSNPLFAQHNNMLDAARTKVELANKDFYPDLTVGSSYAFRQNAPDGVVRSDFLSVNLSINLPIYAQQKQAKAVDQRRSELLREQYSAQDEHNKIHGEIAAKAAEYRHDKDRLALFEHEIIPQAEQTVRSLMAGYQVSKADFSDLLRSQMTLFQYQSQYWQALARSQQVLAELTALVGEEVGHD